MTGNDHLPSIEYMVISNKAKAALNIKFNKKTLVIAIILVLVGVAGYYGWQFYALKNNEDTKNKAIAADIKTQVGKIFAVPTDEEPTVARIENKDSLKDQSFFNRAQNGDYVLVYEKSKLALLYRQQDGKLINAGPITTDSSQTLEAGATKSADKDTGSKPKQ